MLVRLQDAVPVENLMRDPAAIAIHPIYYGAFSNLGILFWSASAAVCFLGSYLLGQLSAETQLSARSGAAQFLLAFGCFSTVLCLDDLFMLHEWLFPEKLHIHEGVVLVSYAVTFLALIFRFRQRLLQTRPILFLVSCLLFATSVAIDVLPLGSVLTADSIYWLEDGTKFLAIFFWLAYFAKAAAELTLLSAHK